MSKSDRRHGRKQIVVDQAAPETRTVSLVLIEVMKSSDASFEPLGIVTAPALVVGSRISEAVNVAVARYVSQFSPACLIRR